MRHNQLGTIRPGLVADTHGRLAFQETDVDTDGFALIEESQSGSSIRQQTQFSATYAFLVEEPKGRRTVSACAELAAKPAFSIPKDQPLGFHHLRNLVAPSLGRQKQIGRASCRERV